MARVHTLLMALLLSLSGPLLGHSASLNELEATLAVTQHQLEKIQARMVLLERQQRDVQGQAFQATRLLLQAHQYPQALQDWTLLRQASPVGPGIMGAVVQRQYSQLAALGRQHRALFMLYQQAQTLQSNLLTLAANIRAQESRPQRRQRALLATTGRDASTLAQQLTQALTNAAPAAPVTEPNDFALTPPSPAVTTKVKTASALPTLPQSRQRPSQGQVLVAFRRGKGAEREGVVLAAQAGSPVTSPFAGRVLFAEGFRQFGGVVILEGPDGHEELVGGLETLQVEAGQQVKGGQPLGTVGPRGRLYWEMRVRGQARNPLAGL